MSSPRERIIPEELYGQRLDVIRIAIAKQDYLMKKAAELHAFLNLRGAHVVERLIPEGQTAVNLWVKDYEAHCPYIGAKVRLKSNVHTVVESGNTLPREPRRAVCGHYIGVLRGLVAKSIYFADSEGVRRPVDYGLVVLSDVAAPCGATQRLETPLRMGTAYPIVPILQ